MEKALDAEMWSALEQRDKIAFVLMLRLSMDMAIAPSGETDLSTFNIGLNSALEQSTDEDGLKLIDGMADRMGKSGLCRRMSEIWICYRMTATGE